MHISTETRVGAFVVLAIGVFAYMTFHIGVFRFDRSRYNSYVVYFHDVAGLSKKADVKIAGVKVGWVDTLTLYDSTQVEAKVMVLKEYTLHADAYSIVRQDGLLGNKYLEIVAGSPLLPLLQNNSILSKASREAVSVDDILHNVKLISQNVEQVTASLKEVLGGQAGAARLDTTMDTILQAAEKFASFAGNIQRFMDDNQEHLNTVMIDAREISNNLRESVPALTDDIRAIFGQVSRDVLPEVHLSARKISDAIDRDFNRIAGKVEIAAGSLDEAALQVRDGFMHFNDVAQKINSGQGLIGKLINEDETYRDLKSSLGSVRSYFSKLENLVVVVDAYSERMNRDVPGSDIKDAKGYFNFRIHPNEDHYWLVGVTSSNFGIVERKITFRQFADSNECPLIPEDLNLTDAQKLWFAPIIKKEKRILDAMTFNAQFAKLFDHLGVRFGLFESTAGAAIDYDIPIPYCSDYLRWVTTIEAFDFNGRKRLDDQRVHLKWLNRVFFMRNLYMTFGADDFVSRENKNAFWGVGIRFADDDLKYMLSRIVVTT